MSAQTKQRLVEVVLVLLTLIALLRAPLRSNGSANPAETNVGASGVDD